MVHKLVVIYYPVDCGFHLTSDGGGGFSVAGFQPSEGRKASIKKEKYSFFAIIRVNITLVDIKSELTTRTDLQATANWRWQDWLHYHQHSQL